MMNEMASQQTLGTVHGSASATASLMSAAEYQAAVDLPPYTELIQGKVIEMTPPSGRHGQVCNRIAYLLTRHADKHQCGHVMSNDSGVQTGTAPDTVRGADVAYLSFAKQPQGPLPDDYSYPAPEVVFEVLSKSDRWSRIYAKIGEYLNIDVQVVVIADPRKNNLRVFRQDGSVITLAGTELLEIPEIKPTFRAKANEFFA